MQEIIIKQFEKTLGSSERTVTNIWMQDFDSAVRAFKKYVESHKVKKDDHRLLMRSESIYEMLVQNGNKVHTIVTVLMRSAVAEFKLYN